MPPDEMFSRSARRRARAGVAAAAIADRWIIERMGVELVARLDAVKRSFGTALVIGTGDLADSLRARGIASVSCDAGLSGVDVRCDEDRLPFADAGFDLVVSLGVLDSVNDVPGALVLIRRILRPGGLFIGAMVGAGSLSTLRNCVSAPVSRFHPQIDVRATGDLLSRAGFALPVADQERVEARYKSVDRLFADLRANGLRNCLAKRFPLTRSEFEEIKTAFTALASGGKTAETINLIYMTGWAPEASNRASGSING